MSAQTQHSLFTSVLCQGKLPKRATLRCGLTRFARLFLILSKTLLPFRDSNLLSGCDSFPGSFAVLNIQR